MIRSISWLAFRIFLYCTLVYLTTFVLWLDAPAIIEDSLTEKTQANFLLLILVLLLWAAVKDHSQRPMITIVAGGIMLCTVREFDWFFENFDDRFGSTWPSLMGIVFVITIILVWLQRKRLMSSIKDFLSMYTFGIYLSGFFVVFVFSRVIGHKGFWIKVMGERYMPFVRRFVEEGAELLGFTLFLIASIELLFICAQRAKIGSSGGN